MKITIQDCPEGEEEEILIRCRNMDASMMKMIYGLRAARDKLTVSQADKLFLVQPSDIYYFESMDNKVFVYLEKGVYETKSKLYELEEKLHGTDFFRASKSTIINLAKIKNFSPAFNGRFEVCMKNGEELLVSRQYVPALKEKLGL